MSMLLTLVMNEQNRSKLEELYIKHKRIMLYTAQSILNDEQLAENAVHKAFLRLANNLEKISDTGSNKTRNFLVIIVRNVSLSMYNERKKRDESGYDELDQKIEFREPLVEDLSQSTANEVIKHIPQLDKKYADVLTLKFVYVYKDAEISQLLGISNENVRIRLHRGRKELIKRLNEVGIYG